MSGDQPPLAPSAAQAALENMIEDIVERTVKRTLLDLNVDVSTPEKLIEFREAMSAVMAFRKTSKTVSNAFTSASVGTAVVGIITVLVLGFREWIARGGNG